MNFSFINTLNLEQLLTANTLIFLIYYILTFISGLLVGSFLNVVSDRSVYGESIFWGRSKCDSCKNILRPKELIPVFSFLLQRGKCSKCGAKLSWYYPLSEVLTGFAFIGIAYFLKVFQFPTIASWVIFGFMAVVACFYIVILLTDLKFQLIPNKIIYPAIGFVLIFLLIGMGLTVFLTYQALAADDFGKYLLQTGYLTNRTISMLKGFGIQLLSAFLLSLFFYFLVLITKGRGMGVGDIKLAFLIGIFNQFPTNVVAIFLSFVLGAIVSLALVLLRKKTLKDVVPFGPFMILGSVLALVWGGLIINWYINLL